GTPKKNQTQHLSFFQLDIPKTNQIKSNHHQPYPRKMFPYDNPEDDLLIWATAADNDYNNHCPSQPVQLAPTSGCQILNFTLDDPSGGGDHEVKKRLPRKEIERRRRREMSDLHSTLLSLLPKCSLKGKKSSLSLSDQMGEAANYINHLKSNVQQLSNRRDSLLTKRALPSSHNSSSTSPSNSHVVDNATTGSVTVRQRLDGVEVVISHGVSVVSRVMEAVVEEGFDIISCVSTQIGGGGFINTMQCQASTWVTNVDLPGLQRKLNEVMSHQSQ
ncbi:Transcription factor bHLH55, partial [Linum grandiflorum]